MDNGNPYAPPNENLAGDKPFEGQHAGSLASAIKGEYELDIGEVISTAWRLVKGFKLKLFLTGLLVMVVVISLQYLLNQIGFDAKPYMKRGDWALGTVVSMLGSFLVTPIVAPLTAGMYAMALKHASGRPTELGDVFGQFHRTVPLIVVQILATLAIYTGMLLLVLPGIFMAVAVLFALPLVLTFELSPWQAMLASIQAVRHSWFSVFGLILVSIALMLITIPTLFIGMIWVAPLCMMMYSVAFIRIFGVDWPRLSQ